MSCHQRFSLLCSLTLLLVPAGFVSAQTVLLDAAKDNTLYQSDDGSTSNGMGEHLFSGATTVLGPGAVRGLLSFDVSSVPAGATITDVSLALTLTRSGSQDVDARNHSLHAVSQDWGEGTSIAFGGQGALATTGDATWLHTFHDTAMWNNAGGDFNPTASATQSVPIVPMPVPVGGIPIIWSSAGLVSDVQGWLDDPSSNFGWALLGDESFPGSARQFASREVDPTVSMPPQLSVTYQIPEPSTCLLAGIALLSGMAFLRR